MSYPIADMIPEDYAEAYALWRQTEGVGLTPSDSEDAIHAYLAHNPGLSLVARHEGRMVGTVLCGHDGRRGYLYHLAVVPAHRKQGLGRRLVDTCLGRLAALGIHKVTIFVYGHNEDGGQFWRRVGWKDRRDLVVLQRELAGKT